MQQTPIGVILHVRRKGVGRLRRKGVACTAGTGVEIRSGDLVRLAGETPSGF